MTVCQDRKIQDNQKFCCSCARARQIEKQKTGHENSKNASAEMIFESHQTEIIILKYLPSFNISLTTPTKQ